VITGQPWAYDATSEWFPALTRRVSVGTAQGYEWTAAWPDREREALALQACAGSIGLGCLERWVKASGRAPDFIYVAKGRQMGPLSPEECCGALREAIRQRLEVVYDGPGATIAAWPGPARDG
jgi:hypothetical protein